MDEPPESTVRRASGFFSLPLTPIGKTSAWLLVGALALILVNNLLVMPQIEQEPRFERLQQSFNLLVFLSVAVAGCASLFAIVRRRERSWVLFASVLLLVLAAALNLGPAIHI
jgi:cytochrome bd-type quinol oxidase subunit 2